jgi:hypothetical protein
MNRPGPIEAALRVRALVLPPRAEGQRWRGTRQWTRPRESDQDWC